MNLSEKITKLRESKNIKQSEMAKALGIDQPNYSRLEKRGEKLTIEQLQRISELLGVDIAYFFTENTPTHEKFKKEIELLKQEIEEQRLDNRILLRQLQKQ